MTARPGRPYPLDATGANRTEGWDYDFAGNMTKTLGYDDANRQTWEEQTVAGYPTRHIDTPRDSDGNRSSLNVPGWYGIQYDYTQRNQLGISRMGAWIGGGGHGLGSVRACVQTAVDGGLLWMGVSPRMCADCD